MSDSSDIPQVINADLIESEYKAYIKTTKFISTFLFIIAGLVGIDGMRRIVQSMTDSIRMHYDVAHHESARDILRALQSSQNPAVLLFNTLGDLESVAEIDPDNASVNSNLILHVNEILLQLNNPEFNGVTNIDNIRSIMQKALNELINSDDETSFTTFQNLQKELVAERDLLIAGLDDLEGSLRYQIDLLVAGIEMIIFLILVFSADLLRVTSKGHAEEDKKNAESQRRFQIEENVKYVSLNWHLLEPGLDVDELIRYKFLSLVLAYKELFEGRNFPGLTYERGILTRFYDKPISELTFAFDEFDKILNAQIIDAHNSYQIEKRQKLQKQLDELKMAAYDYQSRGMLPEFALDQNSLVKKVRLDTIRVRTNNIVTTMIEAANGLVQIDIVTSFVQSMKHNKANIAVALRNGDIVKAEKCLGKILRSIHELIQKYTLGVFEKMPDIHKDITTLESFKKELAESMKTEG